MDKGIDFLNKIYQDLYKSESVMHNVDQKYIGDKQENIKKYMELLELVHNDARNNNHRFNLLKEFYYKKYVIKEEDIPDSYYETEKKVMLDMGYGHVDNIPIDELNRIIINDQKKSLDEWLEYFVSEDTKEYPMWFKYYAFQGMLKIGQYDTKNGIYNKRTKNTAYKYVTLNREVLAKTYDYIISIINKNELPDEELTKLNNTSSFQKIYTLLLDNKKEGIINNDSIEGIWIKYNQGDNYLPLYKSLQGYETGWCTAGNDVCKRQIKDGDFYVYYTKDENLEYKVPRIAIRMNGKEKIGEIRGVAKGQNLEPKLENILEEKLKEFKDSDSYKKKASDIKKLTKLYSEYKSRDLTTEELIFLYELKSKIKGFGYDEDPRIEEIKQGRNKKKDLSIVYGCQEDEIGLNKEDLVNNKQLVYYIGNIFGSSESSKYNLPYNLIGSLSISSKTIAKGLVLPENISGSLYLFNLTNAKGLVLPKSIGDDLDLDNLISAEGLTLPKSIGGSLKLNSLTSAEGLTLPKSIGGSLDLFNLTNAEGLVLPESIFRDLDLNNLTSAEGLVLPKSIGGDLYLPGLKNAKGLVLPNSVGYRLYLSSLTSAEGLVLPESIGNDLDLNSLTSAEGLVLPISMKNKIIIKEELKKEITYLTNEEYKLYREEKLNINIQEGICIK